MTLSNEARDIIELSSRQFSYAITKSHVRLNRSLLSGRQIFLKDEAEPAGTPSTESLNDILNNAVKIPSTTSVVTVPENKIDNTMLQMLSQVRTLESYISTLAAYCIYNEKPGGYDITDPKQAALFTQSMAKWRSYVISGGAVKAMASYLPVSSVVSQSFQKQVTSAELHLEFLTQLFGGFGLPDRAMKELDSILTGVVNQLKSVNFSFESESSSVDHFLTYYYFDTVAGTGGSSGIPAMYDCKVRTMYLHIDQRSWKVSIGKSSVSKFAFNMNYFDMDTIMGNVANDMQAINSAIKQLTGKTDVEISALMSPKAIKADPK
ncbi:hypothetical protein [Pectobacterium sp. A5351]|uniref:hypothetical protein n=1 Tax=Pectobacterium sp. A5351 TaxID=2914983 RepID=UPI002330A028|nr:hypothetical protein [Pectobacterium sp. A5351]WCG81476.1 hypothetical protein O1Q74_10900 [Pectobacterium sp. A5351]